MQKYPPTQRWLHIVFALSGSALLMLLCFLWGRPAQQPVGAQVPNPDRIAANPRDVVINEVAWSGTDASATDEWIELYNTTAVTVSLAGWHLADDDAMDIALSGEIGPHAYYLIERTDDTTVNDIPADLVTGFGSGGLANTGEVLTLTDDLAQVIDTANLDGGAWPAGTAEPKASMERVDSSLPDAAGNWATNDGITRNGLDASGGPITGTPKARNAAYVPPLSQRAELSIGKSGPPTVTAGALLTHHVYLTNTGGLAALDTTITDTLPPTLDFVTQTGPFTFTQAGRSLTWRADAVLTDTLYAITVTSRVSESAVGSVTNHVTATTVTTEIHRLDNHAAWTSTVQTLEANLAISKRGPEQVLAEAPLTYTLRVTNTGSLPAAGVILTDTLPAELAFVTQTGAFTFTQASRTLVWELGALAAGQAHSITLGTRVQAGAGGMITNHITATTSTPEATLDDNVAAWATQVGEAHVLIEAVLYDGYQLNDDDEAVQLVNIGAASAELDGWELCKEASGSLSCRALPTLSLLPGERAWLAKDGAAFSTSFGFAPDYAMGAWLLQGLSNGGDEVVLRDQDDAVVDAVVFKSGTATIAGWSGTAVEPYTEGGGREEGQILARIPDEATGLPAGDTDTRDDWLQTPTDPAAGRRVRYPGWDFDPLFWPRQATEAATVTVGIAPDNAFDVVSETLMRAQESITVEIYALRHPALVNALIAKAQAGVRVALLLEGAPVGIGESDPDWQTELWLCQQIEATGNGACWFMIHKTDEQIFSRYPYIHAKFMIVDDTWLLVSSQNFTRSSLPADDKSNGTYGSRGVVVATNAPSAVARAREIVALDLGDGAHNDVLRWSASNTGDFYGRYGLPTQPPDLTLMDGFTYTVRFDEPLTAHGTFDFELLTAPDSAARNSDALLGLVEQAGAGDSVYVEQMYEYATWGSGPNLRLDAYIEAARRGATVRILVNAKSFDPATYFPVESQHTVTYVTQIAQAEGLDLQARMGDPTGSGIHNKMVLVHLHNAGGYAHVGSINGSESSSKLNREVALQIGSDAVYGYLAALFAFDWADARPVFLPLMPQLHAPPPPPEDYVLISEVYYAGSQEDEWVELHNPTRDAIDLSGYKLGDAESAGAFEPMFQFPAGTVIAPRGVLVIAVNAVNVPEANFELYETDAAVPNMVPYPAWGSTAYPFSLRNDGDHVLLLGPDDAVVDAVIWGDKAYPGVVPHPGVVIYTSSLERYPPYYDTDDCAVDFRERTPGTPGEIPQ